MIKILFFFFFYKEYSLEKHTMASKIESLRNRSKFGYRNYINTSTIIRHRKFFIILLLLTCTMHSHNGFVNKKKFILAILSFYARLQKSSHSSFHNKNYFTFIQVGLANKTNTNVSESDIAN